MAFDMIFVEHRLGGSTKKDRSRNLQDHEWMLYHWATSYEVIVFLICCAALFVVLNTWDDMKHTHHTHTHTIHVILCNICDKSIQYRLFCLKIAAEQSTAHLNIIPGQKYQIRTAVSKIKKNKTIGRKEMFYLTTHSTHFIYGYMAWNIW